MSIDYDNIIKFSCRFTQSSLSQVLNEVRENYEIKHGKEHALEASWRRSSGNSLRTVLLPGHISRDLDRFVCTAALANLIANGPYFSMIGLQTWTTNKQPLHHRFHAAHERPRERNIGFQLQTVPLQSTINSLLTAFQRREPTEYTQFTRGLSYFVNGLKSQSSPILQVAWYLSAIEALLGLPNERLTQDELVERLNIVLEPEMRDVLTGEFRKLYGFRNKFLHGSLNVGIWFGGADYFSHSGKNSSATEFEFEHADLAKQIAHAVLQKYIIRDVNMLKFKLRLE